LAAGGDNLSILTTLGVTGAAFGDAVTSDPGLWRTVGFDFYGRAFNINLAGNWTAAPREGLSASAPFLWRSASSPSGVTATFAGGDHFFPASVRAPWQEEQTGPSAMRVASALTPDVTVAFAANMPALNAAVPIEAQGHMAFAGAERSIALTQKLGERLSASFTSQSSAQEGAIGAERSERRATMVRLDGRLGPLRGAASFGALREEDAALGLKLGDRLGSVGDGMTRFVGLAGSWRVAPGMTLSAESEFGRAQLGGAGLIRSDGDLHTSAFAAGMRLDMTPAWLEAVAPDARGALNLTVRQPLRVDGGAIIVALPTATAFGRSSLSYAERRAEIAPSGREVQINLGYDVFAPEAWSMRFGISHAMDPGHIGAAEDETRFTFGARWAH
jgi:hypothetical protein